MLRVPKGAGETHLQYSLESKKEVSKLSLDFWDFPGLSAVTNISFHIDLNIFYIYLFWSYTVLFFTTSALGGINVW